MKQLKTRLIVDRIEERFEKELGKFLEQDIEGSIQYRTATDGTGEVVHSALVIYAETPQEKV